MSTGNHAGRLCLCLCFFVLIASPLAGAVPDNLVLILDASGSMWGRVHSETKIEAARRVVRSLVGKLPDGARLGLVAYGHRRKGDCADIETLVPPGSANTAAVPDRVDQLNPLGMTPITKSFEQAAAAVKQGGTPATIVLVTDGLETCGGDPCTAVRQASDSGIEFVLHIVGFDVAKENVSSLECAAQAGGGLYIPAESADELSAALERTMTEETPVGDATLAVKSVVDGQLHDSVVDVFDGAGKKIAGGRTYAGAETNPRKFPLEPGSYDVLVRPIRVQGGAEVRFSKVAVEAGKVVEKIADFSTGELSVLVTRNGALSDAAIRVFRASDGKQAAASRSYTHENTNPRIFRLPPGTYNVKVQSVEMAGAVDELIAGVAVTGGARAEAKKEFVSGTLKIGASNAGELADATVNIVNAAGKRTGGGRTYTGPKSNPKPFELPPGTYTVTVSPVRVPGATPQTVTVEVTAGGTTVKTVDFAQ